MEKKTLDQKVVTGLIIAISIFAVFIHVGNYTIFTLPSILFYAWHLMIGLVLIVVTNYISHKLTDGEGIW